MENALRRTYGVTYEIQPYVLILIFLENALRRNRQARHSTNTAQCLNPYFFGKCSTALWLQHSIIYAVKKVLILIFLENALRLWQFTSKIQKRNCLNPYFFGKCSTAEENGIRVHTAGLSLNPYFFGKCSTAKKIRKKWQKLKQS